VTDAPSTRSSRPRLLAGWLAVGCVVVVAVTATLLLLAHRGSHPAAAVAPPLSSPAPTSSSPPMSSNAPTPAAALSPSALPPSVLVPSFAVPGPRPADDKPGPVILIPGYGGDAAMLDGLAARLRKAGRTASVLALPDDATGDLRGQADVLAASVSLDLKKGAPSVDLVGYSAGGIVAALFVAQHPTEVRRVVSIGSPLHGTALAGLAARLLPSQCPVACQQMAPDNPLLVTLSAADPARTGVPWTSMWTTRDEVVSPPESARFNDATNLVLQDVCADDASTHTTLPADPLVAGLTVRALGVRTVASPSASDCSALRALGVG
jgi:triacylglycerol lipase